MKAKPSGAGRAPCGWLLIVALLVLVIGPVTVVVSQHAAVPCKFNSMCSCKTNSALRQASPADGGDDLVDYVDPPIDESTQHLDQDEEDEEEEDVGDVSCVAVPFALLPGKFGHTKFFSNPPNPRLNETMAPVVISWDEVTMTPSVSFSLYPGAGGQCQTPCHRHRHRPPCCLFAFGAAF